MDEPKIKRAYNAQACQTKGEETKNRTLNSAKTLFQAEGIEHVTLEKIAQVANVFGHTSQSTGYFVGVYRTRPCTAFSWLSINVPHKNRNHGSTTDKSIGECSNFYAHKDLHSVYYPSFHPFIQKNTSMRDIKIVPYDYA